MSGGNNLDRRKLLKSIAATGALAKWPAIASASVAEDAASKHYTVFTPPQASLMESLVEQFVPRDDYPGAKDAGVVGFIDRKLAGPFGSFFIGRYEAGLKQIDQFSRQRFDREFASLHPDQQSELLHAIADKTYGADIDDFLGLVLQDTFEGYYGSPEDGGNRDGASWKMIGFGG
jgi:gluconate 2-dehydrogenase gamma chain